MIILSLAISYASQLSVTPEQVSAQDVTSSPGATIRLTNYAWSENIGWISFKDGLKPVLVGTDGSLNGYAWSENIGWIQFGGLSGFPSTTYGANAKIEGNKVTGWARVVSGMSASEYTITAKSLDVLYTEAMENSAVNSEDFAGKWIAYAASGYADSYILLTKLPATSYTFEGETFLVYDAHRIYTGGLEKFKKNPQAAIMSSEPIDVGPSRGNRWIFNVAQLQAETPAVRKSEIINLKSSFHSRFACSTNEVNAPACHRNNSGGYFPSIGYVVGGPIYLPYSDSGGGGTMGEAQTIGTYTVTTTTSGGTSVTTNSTVTQGSLSQTVADNRGGFDGWIALSGVNHGVSVNGTNLDGFAWNSNVVGWIDMSGVKITTLLKSCLGPYATKVPDGQNFVFYTPEDSEGQCASEVRTCSNGKLSGSYTEISCGDTSVCTRAGKTFNGGDKVVFYVKAIAGKGQTCESFKAELECKDGAFVDSNGNANDINKSLKCINNPSYTER
jgi:hypothetical protein